MTITHAIMTTTDDELYASYWPHVSEVWNHFGIMPILGRITSKPSNKFQHPSKFGIVFDLYQLPGVMPGYQAAITRFLLASVVQGNNLVYDIDMVPCNREFFKQFESLPNNAIVTRMHIEPFLRNQRFPGGGLTAAMSTFHNLFEQNGIHVTRDTIWSQEILEQIDAVPRSFYPKANTHQRTSNEYLISQCICNLDSPPPIISLAAPRGTLITSSPPPIGLEYEFNSASDVAWDHGRFALKTQWSFDLLKAGRYWEAHIQRDVDKKLTERICKIILENT